MSATLRAPGAASTDEGPRVGRGLERQRGRRSPFPLQRIAHSGLAARPRSTRTLGAVERPEIGARPLTTSAFDLPDHLAAKADPALIAGDEQHFAAIAESLEQSIADLSDRLDAERKAPGGIGQEALDRDLEIHRLTARLRTLRRFGLDLCLGPHRRRGRPRARLRRTARPHRQRRVAGCCSTGAPPRPSRSSARPTPTRWAWRAAAGTAGPAAGSPTTGTRCSPPDGFEGHAALDDQSAFIASLGSSRSARMRDVLGTIQADQDAIIRAGSRGALVVDGGPGTGKTVVALHRTAYLLYSDPRLGHRRGGVLFVGPQPALPGLRRRRPAQPRRGGRADLHPAGPRRPREPRQPLETDPEVARLKSSADLVTAIEAAVRFYEEPPTTGMTVETDCVRHPAERRRLGRGVRGAGPRHAAQRGARPGLGGAAHDPGGQVRRRRNRTTLLRKSLQQNRELLAAFNRAWPLLEATDLVGDLWSVPAYLRKCAPWLGPDDVRTLQREDAAGLDGVRPAAPGRGAAAARRPGGVTAQAPAARPPSPPSASAWPASSTT